MNLFRKEVAVSEPEVTGVTVLQRTLRARNAKLNANANYARDLEIALHRLNDFTAGADFPDARRIGAVDGAAVSAW